MDGALFQHGLEAKGAIIQSSQDYTVTFTYGEYLG